MIDTILFDLDDTLLGNPMDTFLPNYFDLLSKYAAVYLEKNILIEALMAGMEAMMQNTDTAVTNREIFWPVFQQQTGLDPAAMEPFFNRFYEDEFDQLQAVTIRHPAAIKLLKACFSQFEKVVIATNPVFPAVAIAARLRWAGIPVSEFDYALITNYSNMHATKPNRAYYLEILERIDSTPQRSLMVGDDWDNDIEPAAALGLATFWIAAPGSQLPNPALATTCGSLENLMALVTNGRLQQLAI